MRRVYLDNAATSFPKPPEVAEAMCGYLRDVGANVGRGGYASAYSAAGVVLDTRERLCRLFGFDDPSRVIFTANVTAALNFLLKGLLRQGDHVLVSAMEHNAVMRPLTQLAEKGICFDRIASDRDGKLPEQSLETLMESLLRPETKAVVITHASNVSGTLLPIARVGAFCRAHGLWFLVDSAQTAGTERIDMEAMGIDALAFTGHKGLLGPQGTGGFLVSSRLAGELEPLIVGGTGSFSHLETVPDVLPDRFEGGTLNIPGIYGLNAALCWLERIGMESVRAREKELTERFLRRMGETDGLRLVGPKELEERTAVVSVDCMQMDNAEVAFRLDSEYGIMTRCGLHCAPNAHKTLGTYPQGTIRFSFGPFHTAEEIDYAADALQKILKEGAG